MIGMNRQRKPREKTDTPSPLKWAGVVITILLGAFLGYPLPPDLGPL